MSAAEEYVEPYIASGTIPGVSMAILKAGELAAVYASGRRGPHDSAPVDRHTVFEAASLTKPLVAFIALQLVEQGLLDLDVPLVRICGEYVPGDARSHRITARHVLTHTSGLPNIVRDEAPLKTYFEPGERFSYGSSAFGWLQRAMQTVSGEPLEALARQRVFVPLGMHDSSLEWQDRFAANHAQGHEWEGEAVPKRQVRTAQASWSLLTTAEDYARFVRMVLAQEGLSRAGHAQWFAPAVHPRQGHDAEDLHGVNPPDLSVAWGLGWGLEPQQDCFFHWGHSPGFRAYVIANRRTGDGAVWLANSARGLRLAHVVLPQVLAGERASVAWMGIGSL